MERFGIDYEAVARQKPKIIYCSISGFGQEGHYAEYPALDIIAQAMSGNMSIHRTAGLKAVPLGDSDRRYRQFHVCSPGNSRCALPT